MSEKLNYDQLMALIQADRETDRARAEADCVRAEAEHERAKTEIKEFWEDMRAHLRETVREMKESLAETERAMKSSAAETERAMKSSAAETERAMKSSAAETDRVVKDVSRQLGGMGNSNGEAAENYFYNSMDKIKVLGNETFDYADRNVKFRVKGSYDEYDIVLYNCKSIGIIEVKYKAEPKHIVQTINKAATFRQLCPDEYQEFTLYLGLASFVFDESVEQAALDAGLAVIKQVGDTVVVNDGRVKKF